MFWRFYIWFYHWYGNIDVKNIMLLYSNLGRKFLGQPFHDIPNFNAPKSSFQNKQRLHYLCICFQGKTRLHFIKTGATTRDWC